MSSVHHSEPVACTSNVFYDERFKTFRLYAGSTMYSFCISPQFTLEHLYWGAALPRGFDLRYLSESIRPGPFTTLEQPSDLFEGTITVGAETLGEVMKTYKDSKSVSPDPTEAANQRRIGNCSWRIMNSAAQSGMHSAPGSPMVGSDLWRSSQGFSVMDSAAAVGVKAQDSRENGNDSSKTPSPVTVPSLSERGVPLDLDAGAEIDQETTNGAELLGKRASPSSSLRDAHFVKRRKHLHDRAQALPCNVGKMGKSLLNSEYSDHGTGDFRTPSFIVVDNLNGSSISPLRYKRHAIYRGKLPMPDAMPAIRCLSEREASTLVVTMADGITGLEVDLIYVAMHDYDAITRRAVFRNVDTRPLAHALAGSGSHRSSNEAPAGSGRGNSKVVHKASAVSLDFEAAAVPFHMVQLNGGWGRERYVGETKLAQGLHSFGSMRGVSGHIHNPFAAVTIGPTCETAGEVRGFSFVYSGNFLVEAEVNEMGRLRINIGIHPMGLQWHLPPGQSFNTPEAVLTRSSECLGGLSRCIHRLFLDRLLPRNWSDAEPPVLLNTWETLYFDVNHQDIVAMAEDASKVGINLICLDDGWFGEREDDMTSLGDWTVNLRKFPQGIKGLAEDVNAAGCKFGIWFEPEMVSENSRLYRAHPDWCLCVPGRPRLLGRNQMVLDLSRQDVRDYLADAIFAILADANVEYVKWDMNRPLTEVYSAAAEMGEVWQAEISHRYMLGVYELQQRITSAFPHVLLENCASGGGRFDPGMLYYSPQIWCSDNTDSLTRIRIQYGTSVAYPARSIGAHISPVPNHITGNATSLRTGALVAMCGTFGVELILPTLTPKELSALKRQIEVYKEVSHIIYWGDIYRLWDPFKLAMAAWMYVSRDKSEAVVFAFSLNSDHWSSLVPRLQLQGLLPEAEYEVTEPLPNNITQASGNLIIIETKVPFYQLGKSTTHLTGAMLMYAGLPVKFYTLDDCVMFKLTRVERQAGSHSPHSVPYSTAPLSDSDAVPVITPSPVPTFLPSGLEVSRATSSVALFELTAEEAVREAKTSETQPSQPVPSIVTPPSSQAQATAAVGSPRPQRLKRNSSSALT